MARKMYPYLRKDQRTEPAAAGVRSAFRNAKFNSELTRQGNVAGALVGGRLAKPKGAVRSRLSASTKRAAKYVPKMVDSGMSAKNAKGRIKDLHEISFGADPKRK